MDSLFKKLPANVKQTFLASFPLLVVLILFLIVGKVAYSKVSDLRNQIDASQKTVTILNQKLGVLQTISPSIEASAKTVSAAVPDTNPTLIVISQLKALVVGNGSILSSIKSTVGVAGTIGMDQTLISFTVEGTRAQIFSFLSDISKISPITIVDKIRMTESGGIMRADVSVKSFWAAFPKSIPTVVSPIGDLTASENDVLTKVSKLIQPAFTAVMVPSQPQEGINPNPFGI